MLIKLVLTLKFYNESAQKEWFVFHIETPHKYL